MKVGLICDGNYKGLTIFDSFRYAITSLYPDIVDVSTQEDLKGLNMVIIGHPNHGPNLQICARTGFVEKCNELGITLVVFFSEKIRKDLGIIEHTYTRGGNGDWAFSYFKELNPVLYKNIVSDEDQKLRLFHHLRKAEKCFMYAYDVDDCKEFGLTLFRVALSKKFKYLGEVVPFSERIKGVVYRGSHYPTRIPILKIMNINKVITFYWAKEYYKSWYGFMEGMGQYQFMLSPLGNANGLVARFYEALTLKSIIIQQVKPNTLAYYDKEAQFKNCIFFRHAEEIPGLIKNYVIPEERGEIWLEDVLQEILIKDNLL